MANGRPKKKASDKVFTLGISLRPITRAKLDLVAAGLDRSVSWVVRDAIDYYLQTQAEADQYRDECPEEAARLDREIAAARGNIDEIFGVVIGSPAEAAALDSNTAVPSKNNVGLNRNEAKSVKGHIISAEDKTEIGGAHPQPTAH